MADKAPASALVTSGGADWRVIRLELMIDG